MCINCAYLHERKFAFRYIRTVCIYGPDELECTREHFMLMSIDLGWVYNFAWPTYHNNNDDNTSFVHSFHIYVGFTQAHPNYTHVHILDLMHLQSTVAQRILTAIISYIIFFLYGLLEFLPLFGHGIFVLYFTSLGILLRVIKKSLW